MEDKNQSRAVMLTIDGKRRRFDIDDPQLPDWVSEAALASGGHPYDSKLSEERYQEELRLLQIELVKVQFWQQACGQRILTLFEGRDAAGKGGAISAMLAHMNPRNARSIALPKPSDTERGQWYFQRYAARLPAAGELVAFDRSWYNRAGVEPVMGFCTEAQYENFLHHVPRFEKMIVDDGILFFKFWLDIGQEMQIKRFHDRRHDPLAIWKLSSMDIAALPRFDDYTQKRNRMLEETHGERTPWTVVRANDKRRARLNLIRVILHRLDYDGKDKQAIGGIDDTIVLADPLDITRKD